jgi:hypothetical protein
MLMQSGAQERKRSFILKNHLCFLSLCVFLFAFAGCATNNAQNNVQDYKGELTNKTPFDKKYKKIENYLEKAYIFKYQPERETNMYVSASLGLEGARADYWQLPEQTEKRGYGDCEDKAIWLYCKLIGEGITDIRLVIGKYKESSLLFHAWVFWFDGNRTFILDPSKYKNIRDIKNFPKGYYKPYYSYYKNEKWRHRVVENKE